MLGRHFIESLSLRSLGNKSVSQYTEYFIRQVVEGCRTRVVQIQGPWYTWYTKPHGTALIRKAGLLGMASQKWLALNHAHLHNLVVGLVDRDSRHTRSAITRLWKAAGEIKSQFPFLA